MKSIWDKIKTAFEFEDSSNVESRRRVIKGVAGLAALTVVPVGIQQG